jgi:hypothetical protein
MVLIIGAFFMITKLVRYKVFSKNFDIDQYVPLLLNNTGYWLKSLNLGEIFKVHKNEIKLNIISDF